MTTPWSVLDDDAITDPTPNKAVTGEGRPAPHEATGELLDAEPDQVYPLLKRWWEAQDQRTQRMLVAGEVYERQRMGEQNLWIDKTKDQARWQVYVPPGVSQVPVASFNMADRLCTRLAAQVFADPPIPEAEPERSTPEAQAAAEFATRVLLDLQSEGNLNDLDKHRSAFDYASSWGSGYIHYLVDPTGGGLVPMDIQCHPLAQTADQALTNPYTGAAARPTELVTRYVRADGTLTDAVGEAQQRWLPGLDAEVLPAKHVRLLPASAPDLWGARGVMVATYETLREVEHEFPQPLDEEAVQALVGERPPAFKALLPKLPNGRVAEPKGEDSRDRLVLVLRCYWEQCRQYPQGAKVVTIGPKLAVRDPWVATRPDGKQEALDLPLTQHKQFDDPTNPHGRPVMHFLSGANEARLQILGVMEEVLDRIARRKTFVPMHSTYQPKDAQLPFGSVIPIQPGMEPRYEEVPSLDQSVIGFFDRVTAEMQDAVGLQASGQNLMVPSITSGRQALAVISQVHAGLSQIRQNAERAYIRACRLQLQLVRAFFTAPQRLRWMGEDGEYKEQAWMGSDLGGTRDVRIAQGSMTMLSPMQKVEMVFGWAQHGGVPPDMVQDLLRSKASATILLQDEPHLMRVRRQITLWREGPPPDWDGTVPPDFVPVPADTLPVVAQMRIKEVAAVMATRHYLAADPAWRGVWDQLFAQATQVLAPPPPPTPSGPTPAAPEPMGTIPPLQQSEQTVLGESALEPKGIGQP